MNAHGRERAGVLFFGFELGCLSAAALAGAAATMAAANAMGFLSSSLMCLAAAAAATAAMSDLRARERKLMRAGVFGFLLGPVRGALL